MSLDQYFQELQDLGKPVVTSRLTNLSGLNDEEAVKAGAALSALPTERRRAVLERLVMLSDDNAQLDFTPLFIISMADPDPQVRLKAIQGLAECEERRLIDPLVERFQRDPSEEVRVSAAKALGRFAVLAELGKLPERDTPRLRDTLLNNVKDPAEPLEVRRRALEAVAAMSIPEVKDLIVQYYESDNLNMKASALYAMGRTCDPAWLILLSKEMANAEPELRFEAVGACAEIGDQSAVPDILPLVRDPDPQVRLATIQALGVLGGPLARRTLQQLTRHMDSAVSEAAEEALEVLDSAEGPFGFGLP